LRGGKSGGEIAGAVLKREGVLAGVSDLFVMKASRGFNGLFIEMKFGKNTLTDKQFLFLQIAKREKYAVAVCYSFEEFEKIVNIYLKK